MTFDVLNLKLGAELKVIDDHCQIGSLCLSILTAEDSAVQTQQRELVSALHSTKKMIA